MLTAAKERDLPIQTYIAQIKASARAVENARVKPDGKLAIAVILANLPVEFTDASTALGTLDEVTMEEVTSVLVNAERKKKAPVNVIIGANSIAKTA
jgi:hypothetical protein